MSKFTLKSKSIITILAILVTEVLFWVFLSKYPDQFEKFLTLLFLYPIVTMILFSTTQTLLDGHFEIKRLLGVLSAFLSSTLSSFSAVIIMSLWIKFQEPNASGGKITYIHFLIGNFAINFQKSIGDLLNQLQNASSHTLSLLSFGFTVIPFTLICIPVFSGSVQRRIIYEWLFTVIFFIVIFSMRYFAS